MRFKYLHKIIVFYLFLIVFQIDAQTNTSFWKKSDTLHIKRRNTVAITTSILSIGSLVALNQLWYAEYPKSKFHFINDNNHWKQMDKLGHILTTYSIGKAGMQVLNWSGISKKNQLIYGASFGFFYQNIIEIFDGFSKNWGASWGDIIANATGTGLLVGQEIIWNEQRITPKYSFHQTKYASIRPNTLGSDFLEQSLKDYNGQTYWLSVNIWSFNKKSNFPKWLNIAVGYGANGMLYGVDSPTNLVAQNPFRQFYLSLDIDLSKVKTTSKLLQTIFSIINFIKIPSPTLEFSNRNGFTFHYLYF